MFKPLYVSLVFIILTPPHVRTQDTKKEGESEEELLKRCYGDFGCFSIGKPFLSIYRPINLFPAHPDALNVHLFEMSRYNPKRFRRLNSVDESTSDFDPTKPVKLLVHDYLEDANHPWILQMIQELLTNSDCNIIAVDWSRGATLSYTQSVANARMVGAIIAKFLKDLQEKQSVPPSNVHIIGHGVGAHIAGYVGENFPGLGRITGLDPSGPYFQKTDPQVRLDPSDAEFVDVIHTKDEYIIVNGLEIDELEPSGHLDFYPNGGRRPHGCSHNFGEPHPHDIGCETIPAWQLYIESINSDCPFYGYVCDSFQNFSAAKCVEGCGDGSLCAPLGHKAIEWQQYKKSESVKMYLFTGHSTPACRYHYYVKAQVSESNDADDEDFKPSPPQGLMFIQLIGSKKHIGPLQVRKSHQKDVECLISSKDLGSIIRTDVKWQPVQSPHFHYNFFSRNEFGLPYHLPFIPKPRALRVERFEVNNLENEISEQFCAIGEPILYPNQVKPFFKGGECEEP